MLQQVGAFVTLQSSWEHFGSSGCILEVTLSSTFCRKMSEMRGHGDLIGKGSNMLPWHKKIFSPSPLVSAESFMRLILCSYSRIFSRKTPRLYSYCTFLFLFTLVYPRNLIIYFKNADEFFLHY